MIQNAYNFPWNNTNQRAYFPMNRNLWHFSFALTIDNQYSERLNISFEPFLRNLMVESQSSHSENSRLLFCIEHRLLIEAINFEFDFGHAQFYWCKNSLANKKLVSLTWIFRMLSVRPLNFKIMISKNDTNVNFHIPNSKSVWRCYTIYYRNWTWKMKIRRRKRLLFDRLLTDMSSLGNVTLFYRSYEFSIGFFSSATVFRGTEEPNIFSEMIIVFITFRNIEETSWLDFWRWKW